MTSEMAFTVMITPVALTGIYLVWWTRRETRKDRNQ